MSNQPPDPMGEWMEAKKAWTREAEIYAKEQRVRKHIPAERGPGGLALFAVVWIGLLALIGAVEMVQFVWRAVTWLI